MSDAAARKRAAVRIEKIADQHGLSISVNDPQANRERYAQDAELALTRTLTELRYVKGALEHLKLYEDEAERERFRQIRLDLEAVYERLSLVARGRAA